MRRDRERSRRSLLAVLASGLGRLSNLSNIDDDAAVSNASHLVQQRRSKCPSSDGEWRATEEVAMVVRRLTNRPTTDDLAELNQRTTTNRTEPSTQRQQLNKKNSLEPVAARVSTLLFDAWTARRTSGPTQKAFSGGVHAFMTTHGYHQEPQPWNEETSNLISAGTEPSRRHSAPSLPPHFLGFQQWPQKTLQCRNYAQEKRR